MIDGHVTIIAVPSTRGENRFAIDTPVRRTVPQVPEDDFRYEMEVDSGREEPDGNAEIMS